MITFQDIAVCYKANERYPVNALEQIDLHIASGEWVFLVGPSGAGKSTLLKLVYHGHGAEALQGRIIVDGQDVTHLKPHDIAMLRRKVGVVFQDFQLLTQKTVWENVAFALQVIGTPQSKLGKQVPRALETVGLVDKAHSYPSELSGGEQQRVAIARAIVNNPTVLLADEPTGNLDPQTAADIANVLRNINESGTTILMATHDRNLVDQMRKRVVRIAGGRIVSDEEHGVYHPEDEDLSTLRRMPSEAEDEVHPLDDFSPVSEFQTTPLGSHAPAAPVSPPSSVSPPRAVTPVTTAPVTPPVRGAAQPPAAPVEANASPVDRPAARPGTQVPDYVTDTLENRAPLGSPDNPIVQMDRP